VSDANDNASNFPVLTSSCSGKFLFFFFVMVVSGKGGREHPIFYF
jgi:hypothetical protein